ncbi:MAG: hypothetical protein EOP13_08550 [Pseudomonas sp.]|uniref:hypothetical protein n=1 Tax=Pseudomonas sp. TaxID=306 RepID=UPI0011F930F1|nr:hypothetical protein [Pseudomonas sp.]RZI74484.1 MAG: hypothetical protein EOP13_08550 [Pseudomonas sp.]
MIFVAVQEFSEILPIESDVQFGINSAWREIIEKNMHCHDQPIAGIVCWLSANAKGGHREWVDISRRAPSSNGLQRISGVAGYRFQDPEEALRFREMIGN